MPKKPHIKKVLIIGSGPIQIGQAAEFDFSGSQACRALREEGVEVVLVNSNPATIQTDPDTADMPASHQWLIAAGRAVTFAPSPGSRWLPLFRGKFFGRAKLPNGKRYCGYFRVGNKILKTATKG